MENTGVVIYWWARDRSVARRPEGRLRLDEHRDRESIIKGSAGGRDNKDRLSS